MKKIVILMALILGVSVLPAFAASQLTGKYSLTGLLDDHGKPADVKEFETAMGGPIAVEFLAGGKCKMHAGNDSMDDCTYKLDGNKLTLTVDGDKSTGVVEGNKITITDETKSKMIYEKK